MSKDLYNSKIDNKEEMEFINNTIKLDKELNELDKFVIKFIKVLEKHSDYVIISGYVSILFGRSRATEDIDIFIEELDKEVFNKLYKELKKANFWCLNTEDEKEIYDYLKNNLGVRFAKSKETIPNMEVKFALKKSQKESFKDRIKVIIGKEDLKISSLERQIAFKKYCLKSDKDMEDARHLEKLFKDKLSYDKIRKYKKLIENET